MSIDINKIRKDFPILSMKVRGKDLVYLDNAATTQKPKCVIDKIKEYYETLNSNVHRGVHLLSQKASKEYEGTRKIVKEFINAKSTDEIIFTKGTTDSINLVANSFCKGMMSAGDEVIISMMEHHSNIVPWQIQAKDRGIVLKVAPIDDNGDVILEEYEKLMTPKTKLVSMVHISNAIGTVNPAKQIIEIAHKHGVPVLLDAAQSVQHKAIDVQDLDCDFLVFSGHKIYAPTGVGVLYGKKEYLEKMPPYQSGGDMILSVSFDETIYNELPYKFEAGTPNIEAVIALAEAIKYVQEIGIDNIAAYEDELLSYADSQLRTIDGIYIVGKAKERCSLVSFDIDGIHPHDIGTLLDNDGIAVRTGQHCAEPILCKYGLTATTRASFAFYNTKEEVDKLIASIKKVIEMFG